MIYEDSFITKQTPKEEILRLGKTCDKCNHCCKFTSGILTKQDKKRISNHLKIKEKEFEEKYLEEIRLFNKTFHQLKQKRKKLPHGKCIFLTKQGCKIHEIKPLHCRIGNCSKYGEQLSEWFYLNYVLDEKDPEAIRQWAIYLQTNKTIPGGELPELIPNKEKLKSILNYEDLKKDEKKKDDKNGK